MTGKSGIGGKRGGGKKESEKNWEEKGYRKRVWACFDIEDE